MGAPLYPHCPTHAGTDPEVSSLGARSSTRTCVSLSLHLPSFGHTAPSRVSVPVVLPHIRRLSPTSRAPSVRPSTHRPNPTCLLPVTVIEPPLTLGVHSPDSHPVGPSPQQSETRSGLDYRRRNDRCGRVGSTDRGRRPPTTLRRRGEAVSGSRGFKLKIHQKCTEKILKIQQ